MAADKNLIQGTRFMLEQGRDNSVSSFALNFTSMLKASQEEKNKEETDVDNWLNKVGTPDNIRKIDPAYRDEIEKWVSGKQDEYLNLQKSYKENRDPSVKREIEYVERTFMNLNDQLGALQKDKQLYLEGADKRKLKLGGLGSEWYVANYAKTDDKTTENVVEGGFSVDEDGMIMFGDDSFDSKNGAWNVKNTKATNFIGDGFVKASTDGTTHGTSSKINKYNSTARYSQVRKNLISQSPQETLVLADTDLNTEDENNYTFATQWASGTLNDPNGDFYGGQFNVDGGEVVFEGMSDEQKKQWMQNPDNQDEIVTMMSKYVVGVEENMYSNALSKSFDESSNVSFLDVPIGAKGSGLYIGATQQTIPQNQGKDLLQNLKSGNSEFVFLGRKVTYDPINQVYSTIMGDGNEQTYDGVDDFVSSMGIVDSAFANLKNPKKPGNNNPPKRNSFSLDMKMVTDQANESLFQKFEEIAPGFVFDKNDYKEDGTKRTLRHDHYIVTAPNDKTIKIHLNRYTEQEVTRKRLETFIKNNTN